LSEKPREDEKLSFKEQILRDLERVKRYEGIRQEAAELDEKKSALSVPDTKIADEEVMNASLSAVEKIMENAPRVPQHPSEDVPASPAEELREEAPIVPSHPSQDVPASPAEASPSRPVPGPETSRPQKFERDVNTTPTRVAVSYKTEEPKETQAEAPRPEPVVEAEAVDVISETPRRSRRETVKPVKKKKSHLKAFFISLLIFLALISAGGYFGYQYVQSSLLPVDANSKEYVTVQIPEGSNVQEIGSALEHSGVIKHGVIFAFYAKYKNYSDLKAGYYNLQKSMSTEDIIKELQKGGTPEPQEPSLADLTIPEGYTESLPTKESGARYRLEGYLFPATYSIKESTTIESLIDEMLAAMDKTLTPHYSAIKSKNLTVNELLTIASLVEKEGAKTEDRKLIAGVFYNRLNLGMPLQSNIAILYAQGKLGQNISLADDAGIDTSINSPYNVYTKPGLMPGPVDSPSQDAIEASINQTKSENLYFVANVTDGKVYYAVTQEEHDRNVAEHVNSKLTQNSSSN